MKYPKDFHELCKMMSPFEKILLNNIPLSLTIQQWNALNGVIGKYSEMIKKKIEAFLESEGYSLDAIDDFDETRNH